MIVVLPHYTGLLSRCRILTIPFQLFHLSCYVYFIFSIYLSIMIRIMVFSGQSQDKSLPFLSSRSFYIFIISAQKETFNRLMEIYFHLQSKKQGTAALAAPCHILAISLLYSSAAFFATDGRRKAGVSVPGFDIRKYFPFPGVPASGRTRYRNELPVRKLSKPSIACTCVAKCLWDGASRPGISSALQTPVSIRSTGTSSGGQVSFRWSRQAALSKPGSASMSA